MRSSLIVQALLELAEQGVELLGLYNWPRHDGKLVSVKSGDEVGALLLFDNLLKFELESVVESGSRQLTKMKMRTPS
jgi:hypothetical protein